MEREQIGGLRWGWSAQIACRSASRRSRRLAQQAAERAYCRPLRSYQLRRRREALIE
jgi:hypothetical protein